MKVFLDLYNKLFKKEIVKVLGENNTTFADKYSSSWVHEDYTDALKMLKKIRHTNQEQSITLSVFFRCCHRRENG